MSKDEANRRATELTFRTHHDCESGSVVVRRRVHWRKGIAETILISPFTSASCSRNTGTLTSYNLVPAGNPKHSLAQTTTAGRYRLYSPSHSSRMFQYPSDPSARALIRYFRHTASILSSKSV